MGLDFVSVVWALEERFDLRLDHAPFESVVTVEDLILVVVGALNAVGRSSQADDVGMVGLGVIEVLAKELGHETGDIHPEMRLVADLGMD